MQRLKIIIDTREQTPWSFNPAVADVQVGTLRTGDYSLLGDDHFAIERKSLDDLLGTISTGWPRFCRELNRMEDSAFVAKVIIVEGDFSRTCFGVDAETGKLVHPNHNHGNLTPQFVAKRIAQLTLRNVSVLFAGNPDFAAGLAVCIFKERFEQWNMERVIAKVERRK